MSHLPVVVQISLLFFSVTAVALAVWMRRMNGAAAAWPSVEGEIVESSLDPNRYDRDKTVRIVYSYAVQGRSYQNRRISYSGHSAVGEEKQRLVERYPVGRKIPVFYDPKRPERAVIEREPSKVWLEMLAVAAIFVCLALAL